MTRIGWVVDAQRDFMEPDGRLYVRDLFDDRDPGAAMAEPRLVEAVEWMRAHAGLVVYTGDWHGYDDAEIDVANPDPAKGTYPPHCMGRSEDAAERSGAEIIPSLAPSDPLVLRVRATPTEVRALMERWRRRPRPVLIRKNRFDVFEGNRAADLFVDMVARALGPVEFFVAGVARDVCVTQAIDGLQARGHRVTAIRDAMWGLGLEAEEETLARWRGSGRVIDVADLPRDASEGRSPGMPATVQGHSSARWPVPATLDGSSTSNGSPRPFAGITASGLGSTVRAALERAQAAIEDLAAPGGPPATYENTIQRLDDIVQEVEEALAPITVLLAVAETAELRAAYNAVLPEIAEFWSRLPLHPGLWMAVRAFAATPEAEGLDPLRRRNLDRMLHRFRSSGADLGEEDRGRVRDIHVELARLERRFSENVLDATEAFRLHIPEDERDRLEGIPDAALELAGRKARANDLEGWLLTLDFPSFEPVLKHAHDRALRRRLHEAYVGRCRDGELDNRPTIARILELRRELAGLLGYRDFSDYRLDDAMAGGGKRAFEFVRDLRERTRPYWERDLALVREKAARMGIEPLRPWDLAYVAEALRRERFHFDDEATRPWFPLDRVLDGLFEIARRVFGVRVEEAPAGDVWHEDVRSYRLIGEDGTHLGSFHTDWFPRSGKRQGAWMATLATGGPRPDGGFVPHTGMMAGNFAPPAPGEQALLTHRSVQTVFHEFGHLLHHCASRVPLPSRSGMHVPWDWVEVPSQIMENWTWEREALAIFSGHHETGEPLPDDLLRRMLAARRFMGGQAQMRQLGFATLDLKLHREYDGGRELMSYAEDVMRPFALDETFAGSHILTTFSHLFSGGYGSAYYSYLWSEVLEADAFGRFRAEGILSREAGAAFMDAILARGDGREPEEMFRAFMGRDPDPDALLRRNLGELPEGSEA